jgi:hypothetical protein
MKKLYRRFAGESLRAQSQSGMVTAMIQTLLKFADFTVPATVGFTRKARHD